MSSAAKRPTGRTGDAARLAVGTLTVLPVRVPAVDRVSAGWAMVLAPVVGLLLWLPAGLVLWLGHRAGLSSLLSAALAIGLLAALTRGMHLDGLADTADGLGSGRPAAAALEVMRRGDVGPFGVVTLVLVLLVQVAALAQLVAGGSGVAGLAVALVVSRFALPLACLRGMPSARREGLGATVAGSVSWPMAGLSLVLAAVGTTVGVVAAQPLVDAALVDAALVDAAWGFLPAAAGLLAGAAVATHAVRRLGGITGDVLGAVVEVTFAAALVAMCIG